MRCFISLVLGLLALEVALARNLQEQVFNSVQSMCPEASSSEDADCINCRTNEECAQNAMCCPSSCGRTCQTPVNTNVEKAGRCPWNSFQMIAAGPCPKVVLCSRDSDCDGNMKCCNTNCVMKCEPPQSVSHYQTVTTLPNPGRLSSAKTTPARNEQRAWLPSESTRPPNFRRRTGDVRERAGPRGGRTADGGQ
ncbi:whey acidic protein-like [Grammomys surdaster]|uniref:whey acidic protein-like n=1 Tax=Grammomys surdaster TaxID=491861 RepID=UPI00109F45DC|nr:whey acidic protein-like [Grammomys surdaster]